MKLSTLFSIHDSLTWTSDNYDNDLTSAFWDSSLTTPFQCASPKFATIWLELQAITIVISCLHSGTLVWLLPSNVPLPPNLPSSQSAWRSTWQNQMKLSILFSALKKMKAVIENHVHEVLEEWTKSRSFPHTKKKMKAVIENLCGAGPTSGRYDSWGIFLLRCEETLCLLVCCLLYIVLWWDFGRIRN